MVLLLSLLSRPIQELRADSADDLHNARFTNNQLVVFVATLKSAAGTVLSSDQYKFFNGTGTGEKISDLERAIGVKGLACADPDAQLRARAIISRYLSGLDKRLAARDPNNSIERGLWRNEEPTTRDRVRALKAIDMARPPQIGKVTDLQKIAIDTIDRYILAVDDALRQANATEHEFGKWMDHFFSFSANSEIHDSAERLKASLSQLKQGVLTRPGVAHNFLANQDGFASQLAGALVGVAGRYSDAITGNRSVVQHAMNLEKWVGLLRDSSDSRIAEIPAEIPPSILLAEKKENDHRALRAWTGVTFNLMLLTGTIAFEVATFPEGGAAAIPATAEEIAVVARAGMSASEIAEGVTTMRTAFYWTRVMSNFGKTAEQAQQITALGASAGRVYLKLKDAEGVFNSVNLMMAGQQLADMTYNVSTHLADGTGDQINKWQVAAQAGFLLSMMSPRALSALKESEVFYSLGKTTKVALEATAALPGLSTLVITSGMSAVNLRQHLEEKNPLGVAEDIGWLFVGLLGGLKSGKQLMSTWRGINENGVATADAANKRRILEEQADGEFKSKCQEDGNCKIKDTFPLGTNHGNSKVNRIDALTGGDLELAKRLLNQQEDIRGEVRNLQEEQSSLLRAADGTSAEARQKAEYGLDVSQTTDNATRWMKEAEANIGRVTQPSARMARGEQALQGEGASSRAARQVPTATAFEAAQTARKAADTIAVERSQISKHGHDTIKDFDLMSSDHDLELAKQSSRKAVNRTDALIKACDDALRINSKAQSLVKDPEQISTLKGDRKAIELERKQLAIVREKMAAISIAAEGRQHLTESDRLGSVLIDSGNTLAPGQLESIRRRIATGVHDGVAQLRLAEKRLRELGFLKEAELLANQARKAEGDLKERVISVALEEQRGVEAAQEVLEPVLVAIRSGNATEVNMRDAKKYVAEATQIQGAALIRLEETRRTVAEGDPNSPAAQELKRQIEEGQKKLIGFEKVENEISAVEDKAGTPGRVGEARKFSPATERWALASKGLLEFRRRLVEKLNFSVTSWRELIGRIKAVKESKGMSDARAEALLRSNEAQACLAH